MMTNNDKCCKINEHKQHAMVPGKNKKDLSGIFVSMIYTVVSQGCCCLKSTSYIFISSYFVCCHLGGFGLGPRATWSEGVRYCTRVKDGDEGAWRAGEERAFEPVAERRVPGGLVVKGRARSGLCHIPSVGSCTHYLIPLKPLFPFLEKGIHTHLFGLLSASFSQGQ